MGNLPCCGGSEDVGAGRPRSLEQQVNYEIMSEDFQIPLLNPPVTLKSWLWTPPPSLACRDLQRRLLSAKRLLLFFSRLKIMFLYLILLRLLVSPRGATSELRFRAASNLKRVTAGRHSECHSWHIPRPFFLACHRLSLPPFFWTPDWFWQPILDVSYEREFAD